MKKATLIISVLLILLLTAIELYVQSDAFALRMRSYVTAPLQAVLGPRAQIGWVRVNFIPMYLEVRDISIPDERGTQMVSIRKVKVHVNPFPLLLRIISVPSIEILELRIHAERSREGEVPLLALIEQIRSNIARMQTGGPSRFDLRLRTITVKQGQLSYVDMSTSSQLLVDDLNITAKVSIPGESGKITINDSNVRITTGAYPEVSGRFRAAVGYEHNVLYFDSFELSTADAAVTVSGNAGLSADANLNMKLRIRSGPKTIGKFTDFMKRYRKAKQPEPRIDVSAAIRGKLSDPEISGTCSLNALPFRDLLLQNASLSFAYRKKNMTITGANWKLSRGDKNVIIDGINASLGYGNQGLNINHFDIHAGDLILQLTGRVDPSRGFDAKLTAESSGKSQTLSFLTALPLEGRMGITGYLTGPLTAPLFDGTFAAGHVTIRGIMFNSAEGRLQYREKKISLLSADIRQQASRYIFDGSIDLAGQEPVYAARLKVIRSDIESIVALIYGPLPLHINATGELSFNGTAHDYTGSGRLMFDDGVAYGESFTRGTISASLTTNRISFPQVLFNKGSGTVKASGWIGFDGAYSANLESQNVKLSEVDHIASLPFDGPVNLEINASGSFSHPQVLASIRMDHLLYRQTDIGGLTGGVQIKDQVLLFTAWLADDRAGITAHLALSQPYAWSAEATVKSDTIDPFILVGNKDFAGRLRMIADGRVSAHGTGTSLSALHGTASLEHLSLVVGDYQINNDSPAAFAIDAGELVIKSLNFSGTGTKISITGGARIMKDMDLAFTGNMNLSLLRLLFREVEFADGVAEMKLTLRDEWQNPDISGELRLKKGEIKIKDVHQKFSSLNGKITFDKSRIVADSLTGEMGGGTLSMSGWVQLAELALKDFSAKVSFENVTVHNPEGLTATLSGALNYDGDASEQSLTGEVTIKRARYDKRVDWKSMLVDIGKGMTQKRKTDIGWIGETQINIRFYGKDSVLLDNNLAKVPIDVDIFLRGTVNQPQLLGRLEARKGTVYFQKNEFKILHASADFVDPNRLNPVLDIQAEIQARQYRITLAVTGTADRAVVALISEPSLPDADILSLLALGKTSTELQGKGSSVGMSEAYYFATGQLQDIVESNARNLTGVDRFQVDPYVNKGDVTVPRVTVGKEVVQDKVYLTYSSNIGSTTPEQIFRIEYILNRHFSLQGQVDETTGDTGADIKYRFEFK
ncbi:MAG TPA: translocation/assembly module TamB domain-containing protein [Nitrospirota bacterium]|nr:translocation/assembly module TamB domain-containing protein [Nitrospirota bacterium]